MLPIVTTHRRRRAARSRATRRGSSSAGSGPRSHGNGSASASRTQSLQRMKLPRGYSKSHSPISRRPTFRQIALDARRFDRTGTRGSTAAGPRLSPSRRPRATWPAWRSLRPGTPGRTLQPDLPDRLPSPLDGPSSRPNHAASLISDRPRSTNIAPVRRSPTRRRSESACRRRIFSGLSGPPRWAVMSGSPISRSSSQRSSADHGP